MLKPIWFTAAPKACSPGFRYMPFTLPTEGTPADSPAPRAERQRNKPGTDLTNAVPMPASDHHPTAIEIARFTPRRSSIQPAKSEAAAYEIDAADKTQPKVILFMPSSDMISGPS